MNMEEIVANEYYLARRNAEYWLRCRDGIEPFDRTPYEKAQREFMRQMERVIALENCLLLAGYTFERIQVEILNEPRA